MYRQTVIFPLLASLLVLGGPCYGEPLRGSVSFHQVGKGLLEGSVFSPDCLPQQHTSRDWYQIPDWIAGTWHRDYEIATMRFGNCTFPSKRERIWGHQVDSQGHIWEANDVPAINKVEGAVDYHYMIATFKEPISISDESVTVRSVSTTIRVNKETGLIVKTTQQECIQTYKPKSPDTLLCKERINAFDQDGKPLEGYITPDHFEDNRVAPFSPVSGDDRRNYYADFCQYLKSINRPELIPTEPANPTATSAAANH